MIKIIGTLFCIPVFFIYSPLSHADRSQWICNSQSWNCIYSIKKEGKYLVFRTSQGVKKYNQTTGKWSYEKSNLALKDHNKKILDRASSFTHLIPEKCNDPGFTYRKGIAVDNYEMPVYLLVRGAGEGAVWSGNKVIDLANKITYSLPYQYYQPFRSIYVDKNDIWLGSYKSIARISKKDGKFSFYTTISDKIHVRQPFIYKDRIYYISNYGLVSVSQDGKIYEPFTLINKKYVIDRLIVHENKMVLFARTRDLSKARDINLLLFKTNKNLYRNIKQSKVHKIETTNVTYIDSVILKNNNLYAFGHSQEWIEGGEYSEYGGSFKYSFRKGISEEIVTAPVGYLDLKNKIAITRTNEQDGSITLKVFSIDKRWPITEPRDVYIVYPNKKYVDIKMKGKIFKLVEGDRWDGKKVEVTEKKKIEKVLYMLKVRHQNKIDKTKIEKVRNILGKNIRTNKIERGKVEIQYFDQE